MEYHIISAQCIEMIANQRAEIEIAILETVLER